MTEMTSMQEVKVRGQRSRSPRSASNRNSSLNLHMMMKRCTELDVAWERCPIVFNVIRQISRSHGYTNLRFRPKLGASGL